ncbi:MAG: hypothetical protein JO112_04445 [Planctomycetes bacterium]|nr:hypothetical protein [Planctomycetota bacterium]
MATLGSEPPAHQSPLEEFVREYVETIGGAWDEVEPQVYDVLLPVGEASSPSAAEVLRMAFDPEALPEHSGAQLASFGTPLIDRLLNDAVQRGRYAQFYFLGLNLAPHDLAARVRRAITLAPNLELRVERVRPLFFAQAVFWFQITFVSDQKEHEILPLAMDLHYGRPVRHLEKLLDFSRLTEHPPQPLPEARRLSLAAAYPLARAEVIRILAPLANTRERDLRERLDRQAARMARYYADLGSELDEQEHRARGGEEARERLAARREAIDREQRLRLAELRQKNTLRVQLHLLNLLVIQQPKLLATCGIALSDPRTPARPPGRLELVWDPLLESLEAAPCPACGRPSFAFGLTRTGGAVCPTCAGKAGGR